VLWAFAKPEVKVRANATAETSQYGRIARIKPSGPLPVKLEAL
jgi:hypothetical protein